MSRHWPFCGFRSACCPKTSGPPAASRSCLAFFSISPIVLSVGIDLLAGLFSAAPAVGMLVIPKASVYVWIVTIGREVHRQTPPAKHVRRRDFTVILLFLMGWIFERNKSIATFIIATSRPPRAAAPTHLCRGRPPGRPVCREF